MFAVRLTESKTGVWLKSFTWKRTP